MAARRTRDDSSTSDRLPSEACAWVEGGTRTQLSARLPSGGVHEHSLWLRSNGKRKRATPWLFLHGFPTSSYDWHAIEARLAAAEVDRARIYLDLLGFGASEKPAEHRYTIEEQASLLIDLGDALDMREMHLVVHDYSVSIAQHILHLYNADRWTGPRPASVTFLNGGLFPETYTPLGIQRLLTRPGIGDVLARLLPRSRFVSTMRSITGPTAPLREQDLEAMWRFVLHGKGRAVIRPLSAYHEERRVFVETWRKALGETAVPLRFLWGAADPISGNMLEQVEHLCPNAIVRSWDDVGHYPQLEAPERVAAQLLAPWP